MHSQSDILLVMRSAVIYCLLAHINAMLYRTVQMMFVAFVFKEMFSS